MKAESKKLMLSRKNIISKTETTESSLHPTAISMSEEQVYPNCLKLYRKKEKKVSTYPSLDLEHIITQIRLWRLLPMTETETMRI